MNLKETLKQVFQSPYSQNQWISALTSIFGSSRVRFKVEPSPEALNQTQKQLANAVERVGEITLESGQELPFFEVELNPKIKVERNRVGINDLVKNLMLRGSTTEGALAVFYYPPEEEKSEWRFSFVSKEAGSEFFNELDQKETKPQRYTYVFGTDEGHKTAIDRFTTLSDSGLALDDLFEAFSVQSISDDFFREYQEVYLDFVQFLTGKRLQKRGGQYQEEQVQQPSNFLNLVFGNDEKAARDFCKKLIGRIVFLYFLQKKGWLGASIDNDNWDDGDPDFLKHLFEESGKADDFYNQWLSEVFFNTLNCSRPDNAFTMPDGRQVKMPYLNGGLFDDSNEPAYHKVIAFPPWVFEKLFDLLGRYNFTVYEDSPEDHIVAVDPEMLGHIFENLLEDNKEKGTYYTPKEIVHYMCQESLVEYLLTHLSKPSTKAYRRLGSSQTELFGNEGRKGQLAIEEEIQDDEPSLNRESLERFIKYQYLDEQVTNQQQVIEELMDQVKICDPAIGSGAFPMGLLQEIIQAKEALHEWRVEQNLEDRGEFDPVPIKLNLIQNAIHGVDIEQGAIDIARLRFWLSLVVDEKQPQLLPNLDYKIMQGNSLLESYGDIDLNIDNIQHDLIEEGSNQFTTKDKERLKKLVNDFYLPENVEQKPEIKKEIDGIVQGFIEGCSQSSQKKVDKEIDEINRELALINQHSQKQEQVQKREEKRKTTLKKQLEKATKERNKLQEQADELREMFKKQEFNFFLWHLWFQDVFQKGGFDIIIGNPPYVKEYDNKNAFDGFRKSPYYQGKMDIWYGFACIGIDILKSRGHLCFIAQNNWITSAGASKLRDKVLEETEIKTFIDFNDYQVFDLPSIQTMIVILQKKHPKQEYNIRYGQLFEKNQSQNQLQIFLNSDNKTRVGERYKVPFRPSLYRGKTFRFNKPEIEKLLNTIASKANKFLEENEISTGIDVHQDKVNKDHLKKLGSGFKVGDGIFQLSNDEYKRFNLNKKEKDVIKPFYTSQKLFRYYGNPQNSEWVIYLDKKRRKNIQEYPTIRNHLDQFKDIITSDFGPYGLHRSRDERFFKGEKIMSLRKCAEPTFTYTDFDCYVSQSYFVIKPYKINLKFLTGLLNSQLIKFWLQYKGKLQGKNFQIDKEPLKEIPILIPKSIDPIETLVDYIIFLKSQNLYKPEDKFMPHFFEQVIDGLIYELYFPELFKKYNQEFWKNLPYPSEIENDFSSSQKLSICKEYFLKIYNKSHPIRNNVFYLDSIPKIRKIEGKNEDNQH